MNDEHTVVPETADDMSNYEIQLDGEWVCVVGEMMAKDIPLACPTCKKINIESIVYFLENSQYLYKGMCCGMFGLLVANGEDNDFESE
jgi:hypothetical protein|tara:strand:- start:739 stop:1002 length:264 start_codon:yes stop_codon:yes gene_type:complete